MICCLDSKDSRICAYPKTKSLISECYKMGDAVDYRGSVNTTISGKACQYWTSQIPHKHARTTVKYPDKGLGDHNLCRNPDGEVSAWCYTTDPTTRYEMCDIGNPGENCGTPELNSMCPESNNHVFFTNIACSSDNECEEDLLCCFRESVGQVCAFSKTKNLVTELNSLCPLSSFPGYFTNIACGTDDDCPSDLLCCHGDNVGQACAFSKTKSLISECYKIENAVDYRGAANTTISGKACQSWTSQTPHKHTRRQDRYPDSGVGDHNLCRNPDKESSAWCYTTDPKTRWEVCDIGRPGQNCGLELNSMCPKSNKHMFFTNIPCSSDNECEDDLLCCFRESAGQVCAFSKTKEIKSEWHSEKYPECFRMADAVDYRGSVNTTETGKACQPWTSQTPHGHTRTSVNYPDMGLGDHNLCRNPDREPFAWCYTADPTSRWEVCDIGKPGENCGGTENNPTLLPGFHLSGYECNTVHDCINIFGPNAICCNSNGHLVCAEPTYAKSLISEKPKSIVDKTLSDLRPDQIIPEAEDRIRFCVPSACEYKKCQRMVNELIYNLIPRQDWRCIQAESREHCAYLVSKRFADVAVARVDGIYTAIKKYKLKPIAYEAPVIKGSSESEALNVWESITLAITKRDNSDISRWSDLRGKKSCHAGIKEIFSFKAPVCSLIQKDIIPRNGDYVESASQYFSGSCVPGILDEKYNVQSTYPLKLCDVCAKNNGLCGISDRYAGIEGSLQCIDESKGQVTFIDNKSLEKIIADGGASKYKVVCEGESIDLENDANSWKTNKACHLAVTPRPTVMVSPHKTADYISTVMDLLAKASKNYGKKSVSSFKLFESLSYKCQISEGVYEKDVIFRDAEAQEIREFVPIGDKPFAADYIQEYSSCMKMVPQPRAKFCVVTRAAFDKCLKIKENFDKTELVNTVAWGCVLKPSKMECMRAVQEGSADLLSTDATETFIAGREFKLQPILSQYFDTLTTDIYPGITKNAFNDTTYTYTIGIMKKDRFYDLYGADTREITSLRDLNTCHAGMKKLSSFHHPIGWLLANGTVPRIGSIFESVKRYFGRSCLPGSDPAIWRMDADLLMGHEINWGFRSLNFYNFTGFDWFIWNSPATWNYYNWNKYTPATLKSLLELVDEEVGISRVEHGEHEDIDWDMLEDILNYPDGLMSPELDDPPINMFNSKRKESDKQIRRKILSYALQTRTERMEKLGEIMQLLHNIPTLQDIRTDDEDWLSHPAVQSYLQIYFPSMVGFTSEIFEDAEIRKREFNRYNNPIWLSSGYADFVNTMQSYQKDMCSSCIGYGDKKCQETTAEPYYDYAGALACLEEKGGDISFFEAQEFQKLLNADSSKRPEEYILVCPTGAIRLYEKDVSVVEQCNFGRVPYPAVVTGQERTGTWRWEVTKAILEAQKTFGVVQHREQQHEAQFTIFGVNSVFDVATTEVKPIDILDQIYEVYIGQNLLRSMEAIIKPSNLDWWKEDAHKCYGETYSSVIVERQGGCNAVIKDLICIGAPPAKVLSVGRSGVKKAVTTEMCSRPTKHIKKPAEFTCEDGEGYTKYVDVAVNCECVPCEDVTYTLEWTKDSYWKSDAKTYQRNRGTTKETDYNLWGTWFLLIMSDWKQTGGKINLIQYRQATDDKNNNQRKIKRQVFNIRRQKKSSGFCQNKIIMPFLRKKQSHEGKKKMEHKMYLARESPEPTFDLSDCEMTEVPPGVYSLCNVLRKEGLLLHNNNLMTLKGGGQMKDLCNLRVIDLHSNDIRELPDDITQLICLQVMNLQDNKIKLLPKEIGKLKSLQTLNLKGNQLQGLPGSVREMKSLRMLDVVGNPKLTKLPLELCYVRTLETLSLDADQFKVPPSSVCSGGTEAIMRYLCAECGTDYSPPSQHLLNILDPPVFTAGNHQAHSLRAIEQEDAALENSIMQYEKIKEQKRLEHLTVEKEMHRYDEETAKLMIKNNHQRQRLVMDLARDQHQLDSGIAKLQTVSDVSRKKMVATLSDVEHQSDHLLKQLLEINEKARKQEALIEQLEKERMELEEIFKVATEEHASLRKQEIMDGINLILNESFTIEKLRIAYERNKEDIMRKAQSSENDAFERLGHMLNAKQVNQQSIVQELMKEEAFQREAFETLMVGRDARHKRLTGEIGLIEQQLADLTMFEMQKAAARADTEQAVLEQKRLDLTCLLKQLMLERENREFELKKRLEEMEKRREDDEQDYWLIQFQRLLDRKPQSLINLESNLEYAVENILNISAATIYIPMFARNHVSIESLLQMDDESLKTIGVREPHLRKAILLAIDDYAAEQATSEKKTKEIEGASAMPSAPPEEIESAAGALAPSEVTVHINTECVVCLENNSNILFLNCGHVCCCFTCSGPINLCPLCRRPIETKIKLNR
ncbi:uncharacterized protein [Antedon mediterranea]|uniref:uncharacterized protein n=1 Tax=Antedon mediterranea TaxID=105859 RepID=UPI003AF95F76